MPEVPRPRARKPSTKTPPKDSTESPPATDTTGTTDPSGTTEPKPWADRTPADRKLAEAVSAMYSGVGMLVMGIGIPRAVQTGDGRIAQTGNDIQENADRFAEAWMVTAERNPKVKALLKKVTEGGAFAEVVALHLSLLLPYLPGIPGLAGIQQTPDPTANGAPTGF